MWLTHCPHAPLPSPHWPGHTAGITVTRASSAVPSATTSSCTHLFRPTPSHVPLRSPPGAVQQDARGTQQCSQCQAPGKGTRDTRKTEPGTRGMPATGPAACPMPWPGCTSPALLEPSGLCWDCAAPAPRGPDPGQCVWQRVPCSWQQQRGWGSAEQWLSRCRVSPCPLSMCHSHACLRCSPCSSAPGRFVTPALLSG